MKPALLAGEMASGLGLVFALDQLCRIRLSQFKFRRRFTAGFHDDDVGHSDSPYVFQ